MTHTNMNGAGHRAYEQVGEVDAYTWVCSLMIISYEAYSLGRRVNMSG